MGCVIVVIDFCIKVVGLTPTSITIYWIEPVIDYNSLVSYYQVSWLPLQTVLEVLISLRLLAKL